MTKAEQLAKARAAKAAKANSHYLIIQGYKGDNILTSGAIADLEDANTELASLVHKLSDTLRKNHVMYHNQVNEEGGFTFKNENNVVIFKVFIKTQMK